MAQATATTERATDIGDGLELRADGSVECRAAKRPARAEDVAPRTDLDPRHPLYGSRAVRCVPSGMPDCVIADGRLVPVDLKTGLPVEAKPLDLGGEKHVEPGGEVVRDR